MKSKLLGVAIFPLTISSFRFFFLIPSRTASENKIPRKNFKNSHKIKKLTKSNTPHRKIFSKLFKVAKKCKKSKIGFSSDSNPRDSKCSFVKFAILAI
ncbi:hypothetical protein [Helicobacter magdeburgensis]|uniref:hypothetical protein n=1 Tax=Helicobacter magdeburgensis TaxID=471858 RepID=UPI00142D6D41|nr:hypothetical protein [Helicobacter magdeburgensis]